MNACLFLCAATADDVAVMVDLDRRCCSHPWTNDHFAGAVRDREHTLVLALRSHMAADRAGSIVGHCVVQVVADEAHIHTLAIDTDLRRRGLGRWLLSQTLALARKRGARRALLEVREGNSAAKGLYSSTGFFAVGRRRAYYAQPTEDALLLEKALER